MNLALNIGGTSVTRQASPVRMEGVVLPAADLPARGRMQLLSNHFRMTVNATAPAAAWALWNTTTVASPPATACDAIVAISMNLTQNMTIAVSSILEINGNVLTLTNANGSVYGVWIGGSLTSALEVRQSSQVAILSNLLTTTRFVTAKFFFVVIVMPSLLIATNDALGSGMVRLELNHLFNVDKTFLLSGCGIYLGGTLISVGGNSVLSIRSNRLFGFPRQTTSDTRGGFVGVSFMPFFLTNTTAVQSAALYPLTIQGSRSLCVIDGNIIYVTAVILQPTMMLRGFVINGASSAVRITNNYLGTIATSSVASDKQRSVVMMFGGLSINGQNSVVTFVKSVVTDINFGGLFWNVTSLLLPSGALKASSVTKCTTCRFTTGCVVFGKFSEDSTSMPAIQISVSMPSVSTYPATWASGSAPQDVMCSASCQMDIACFTPGTVIVNSQANGDNFPTCSCRCYTGFSVNRQCGPVQGLTSNTISISNHTFEQTVTDSVTPSQQQSLTRSKTAFLTDSEWITNSLMTTQPSATMTRTKSHSKPISISHSRCVNFTGWPLILSAPFQKLSEDHFFANLSFGDVSRSIPVNITAITPSGFWNVASFNKSFGPATPDTPVGSMVMLSTVPTVGVFEFEMLMLPVSSSRFNELRYKWKFEIYNEICANLPFTFYLEILVNPDPIFLANETRTASIAGMFVASLLGNTPMASLLPRAPMLTGAIACSGPGAPYDDTTSMTFFRFGSIPQQYARGGVVGNIIAVAVVMVGYVVFSVVFSLITHVSSFKLAFINAMEAFHIKSCYAGAALCVLQPTLAAGIALLRDPVDDNDTAIGAIGVAVSALYTVFVCLKLLVWTPDVVLVYDLIRPHQRAANAFWRFIRFAFWPKYHFLCTDDLRRKIERMLLKDPATFSESEEQTTGGDAVKTEEVEEDNEKLLGLTKMTQAEFAKSKRWDRIDLGDVLLLPPVPVKPGEAVEEEIIVPPSEEDETPEPEVLADLNFTDLAQQVATEASNEMLFVARGEVNENILGIGIITESERLSQVLPKDKPMLNLVELQKQEREREKEERRLKIEKAKIAARKAREKKIADIRAKIEADIAEAKRKAIEAKHEEEERVLVPLHVLDLMRAAKAEKHEWYYLIRGWRDPRFPVLPHVTACILGVAQGFGDGHCIQLGVVLTVIFCVELIAFGATRLGAFVLPFHQAWTVLLLTLGLLASITDLIGNGTSNSTALEVSAGFTIAFTSCAFLRVVIDGLSSLFHMRTNAEKVLSLIARDQTILSDTELALPFQPPPLPPLDEMKKESEEPIIPPTLEREHGSDSGSDDDMLPPPPAAPPQPAVLQEFDEDEEFDDEYDLDPNRLMNPLGVDL